MIIWLLSFVAYCWYFGIVGFVVAFRVLFGLGLGCFCVCWDCGALRLWLLFGVVLDCFRCCDLFDLVFGGVLVLILILVCCLFVLLF